MMRTIDPDVARSIAGRLERVGPELSVALSAAVTVLQRPGADATTAARERASVGWWAAEAARMRARADAIDGSTWSGPTGPTISGPPSPRNLLLADISSLEAERARLARQLPVIDTLARFFGPLVVVQQRLYRSIAALDVAIQDRRAWSHRQLLSYDPSGDGQIVEVFGDLAHAHHVVVLVPGVGTDLASYERGFHVDALHLAERLAGRDVAVVAWLGYDPPDSLVSAVSTAPAEQGAASLAVFVEALPQVHLTVIGHSYGSLVAGLAVREYGLAPDELVFIGSPGVGVDDVDQLELPRSSTVWAALTPLDPIQLAKPECLSLSSRCALTSDMVFGVDPHDAVFGARTFAAGDAPVWNAHSAYYREGSASLDNLAHIVVGEDDAVR
jgi:pimeloyl-ACP methyl ester carboxylesterase